MTSVVRSVCCDVLALGYWLFLELNNLYCSQHSYLQGSGQCTLDKCGGSDVMWLSPSCSSSFINCTATYGRMLLTFMTFNIWVDRGKVTRISPEIWWWFVPDVHPISWPNRMKLSIQNQSHVTAHYVAALSVLLRLH